MGNAISTDHKDGKSPRRSAAPDFLLRSASACSEASEENMTPTAGCWDRVSHGGAAAHVRRLLAEAAWAAAQREL